MLLQNSVFHGFGDDIGSLLQQWNIIAAGVVRPEDAAAFRKSNGKINHIRKVAVPDSSLMMILSRGVGGASFDLVMQICRKLNIDPASLSESNGTEEQQK